MVKKELLIFLDTGLVATFVRFLEHELEQEFVYLEYCPLDRFPAKKIRYPRPIPRRAIFARNPTSSAVGIADRIIIIYTGEDGSLVGGVIEGDIMKKNVELEDKVRSQELEIASLKQELETANTGVNKKIADIRSLNRQSEQRSPFGSPFGSTSFGGRPDDDYSDDNGF